MAKLKYGILQKKEGDGLLSDNSLCSYDTNNKITIWTEELHSFNNQSIKDELIKAG